MTKESYEEVNLQKITSLLEGQGYKVDNIWRSKYDVSPTQLKGESAHGATQYDAEVISKKGKRETISFFVKTLNYEQLDSEIKYVKALRACGLGALTYTILANDKLPYTRAKGEKEYMFITFAKDGIEPLSNHVNFERAEDGTVLSENGELDFRYVLGVVRIFAQIHTNLYFAHLDSQPKNFNLDRSALLDVLMRRGNPDLWQYNGIVLIDFETGKDLPVVKDPEESASTIAKELSTFLDYIKLSAEDKKELSNEIRYLYQDFLNDIGYVVDDLLDYLRLPR